jgi:hypothetical protein
MSKRILGVLLIVFVVLDLALSFWQNYQFPLDGDLVGIVLPAQWYTQILHDPFGWSVLTHNAVYAATNRFFVHATMGLYWKNVPLLLQYFISPISSLYAASALFTTAVQASLLFLLAVYIRQVSGGPRGHWSLWVVAALLVPLFQTEGFYEQMGVTDRAVTYTSFYGYPMSLLLVLLWPFYRAACQQQPLRVSLLQALLLIALMLVVAFSGPIATASIAVLLLGIGVHWAWGHWQTGLHHMRLNTLMRGWLSWQAAGLLALLAVLCLYSMYIGRNNAENSHDHTLRQLYQLLPMGVYIQLTHQAGLPVLLGLLLFNAQLVRWLVPASPERQRVLLILRWVGLFAVVFILLLPLGGYRTYRPHLLRNDSVLPVLLGLFFAYGVSTYFLLFQLKGGMRASYLTVVCLFGAYFMYADRKLEMPANNGCERWSMDQLARAQEPVVRLVNFCNVMTWAPLGDYHESDLNAQMLYYWHVTPVKKLYYQQ